ncbi:MAG: hypothetical protein KME09_06975 [Pleurocapsa minor HA4230-MV1]|jgi:integrase|nr:hypothetical protein [Pleurocapsa minor HA4230-MV1]
MSKRKEPRISVHNTLQGKIEVNWEREYFGEYNCPKCKKNKNEENKLDGFKKKKNVTCKLALHCKYCKKDICLTNRVSVYIYNYRPEIECPNPLCNGIGHNGQKGWVYRYKESRYDCKCYFCGITFNPKSTYCNSWISKKTEEKLSAFCFDDDIWDLRHFSEKPFRKTLNFQTINPLWYREEVKKYLHYLLKLKVLDNGSVYGKTGTYRQFGEIITNIGLKNKNQIDRNAITLFLSSCTNNDNETINQKLSNLRDFFEWLNLETAYLIRSRDSSKISKNAPDWLDEIVRQGIEQHLSKIPDPIARHYHVQAYIAARPGDVCELSFDCLIEENGKWYIKFLQGRKVKRWLRIPASRKIRKVIEKQQQWIREVLGEDYSYLFCHFRSIKEASYPVFSNIKPLPKPPLNNRGRNPMVSIIRMIIEKENILDANGQKPYFTGKITRSSRLQEVRAKYGIEAAQLYAGHKSSNTTFQHYAPPTREQIAKVDLPFQELLLNPDNKFLPWQSLPESLLKNPKAHELDLEIAPRLVVYGHCALDPKTPCPVNLFPKCYGCSSFRPSTGKLPLYERQYQGEQQRLTEAEKAGAELASEEAKATIEAMDKWLPELRRLANG